MEDIRRLDQQLWTKELIQPGRILLSIFIALLLGQYSLFFIIPVIGAHGYFAWRNSINKRWIQGRFKSMWESCKDRFERFENALAGLKQDRIADLTEMPKTVHKVAMSLYAALRRADLISHEISRSEKGLYDSPSTFSQSSDPQAKELYRIAEKNLAEYKQQFAGVVAGVHRAEAQAAVFMTTLDNLRLKMVSYRLTGRKPEMDSQEFLEALGEAKIQLSAIDKALEELDFTEMPQMIAVIPPAPPNDAMDSNRLGRKL